MHVEASSTCLGRARPVSTPSEIRAEARILLGSALSVTEFADFERIPQGVSGPAAQGFYPKSAVSANSTIIPISSHSVGPHIVCSKSPPASCGCQMSLLLIVFDGVGRAHVRDLGILSRVAARAALA